MFLRASAILFVLLILTACGSVVESTFTEITPEASEPGAPTTSIALVICDFFAAGGPNDRFTDAAIAAIESVSGVIADLASPEGDAEWHRETALLSAAG